MYNLGFILSFFSTFIIILLKNYLIKLSNIKSLLMITIFINLFTFPIIININNEFNLLSPIINILMIFIVEGIIIPLSFIVAVLPILNIGYTYIISGFISLNDIIADISYKSGLVIIIGNLSTPLMIAYYFIIFLIIIFLLKPRVLRYMYLLYFTFLILLFLNIKITNTIIITFLDLYNGESTLIEYKNEIILIDTGEGLILIDPGKSNTLYLVVRSIYELGYNPKDIKYIINTHWHCDHTEATSAMVDLSGAKTLIGFDDAEKARQYFMPDILIKDGDTLTLGNTTISFMKTPGHTKGTISFFFETEEGGRTYRVGMFGGAGANTMAQGNFDYEGCREDYRNSLHRLQKEKVDVLIGNHVWNNDTALCGA